MKAKPLNMTSDEYYNGRKKLFERQPDLCCGIYEEVTTEDLRFIDHAEICKACTDRDCNHCSVTLNE